MSAELGQKDERYTIEARIGSGAMATVYRAYDQRLQRIVALKILHEHLATNSELRLRFEQEAKLAARIDHPNVVRIYDIGLNAQDQLFIISEFIDGKSLTLASRQYSNRASPFLNPILSALVAHEIARGIDAAHRHSVVHRDLKPDNVLVSNKGEVKLTDFGVARPFDSSMTQVGQFIGSLTYASPEQVHGGKIDSRSDIFSFGVILFELLTGRTPFRATNPTDLAIKISQAEVPPLNQIRTSIPFELDAIVRKCLRANPSERPQTAEQIVRELYVYLSRNEVLPSAQAIHDGFANPLLFSSTIRRSPIKNESEDAQTKISEVVEADADRRPEPEPLSAAEPSAEAPLKQPVEPLVKPSAEAPLKQPADAPMRPRSVETPNAGEIRKPIPQPTQSDRLRRQLNKMQGHQPARKKQNNALPWFSSFLLLAALLAAAALYLRQREESINQQKNVAVKPTFSPAMQPTSQPTVILTPPPTPAPTRPPLPQRTPEAKVTQQAQKNPAPSVTPARRTPAPIAQKVKTPSPANNKQVKEPTKPKSVASVQPAVKAIEPKSKSSEQAKANLQIQTSPGPRTIEIIRNGRKEFLGLSPAGNSPRVFNGLEPGLVTLNIPTEEVDGKKFEGIQKQIRLEAGKQFTLPALTLRQLKTVTITCPPEVRIVRVNGRKINHRGGFFSFELPIGTAAEIEATGRAPERAKAKFDIRDETQQLPCPVESKKDR
ncbi:MAG: Cmm like protein [Pseudomonadota bacterium]